MFTEWEHSPPPIQISVAIPRRVVEADTLEGFAELLDVRDLQLLQSLKVEIGHLASGPRATIHLERKSPALTFEIGGGDATRVAGAFTDVVATLDRGRTRIDRIAPYLSLATIFVVLVVGLTVMWLTHLAYVDPGDPNKTAFSRPWGQVAALVVAVSTVLGGWMMALAYPVLEVLPPGGKRAADRLRGLTITFVVSVAGSLAAAIVIAAATSYH